MFFNGVEIHMSAFLFPLFIIELYVFALGLALLLSALNVKYRDTAHIWEIIMQAAFYATPIIYPLSLVIDRSQWAAQLLMLNPVAQAIQDARYVLITTESVTTTQLFSNPIYLFIPFIIVIITLIIGVLYFKKNSRFFAENI
jgi:ABC-2 type transport system permease protein